MDAPDRLQLNKGSPREQKGRLEMGSPSNVDVVTGSAEVKYEKISTEDWCEIVEIALRRIRPCLKYVAGFKTLDQMLNGHEDELLLGRARFIAPDNAMPDLKETGLNQRTRFVALQVLKPREDTSAKTDHEISHNILLLTENGYFAFLKLSFFKHTDIYRVCGSSLVATSSAEGFKSVLGAESHEIRSGIESEAICPYGVLDTLYLLFYNTVADKEKRLASMRGARDWLQQVCYRITH